MLVHVGGKGDVLICKEVVDISHGSVRWFFPRNFPLGDFLTLLWLLLLHCG